MVNPFEKIVEFIGHKSFRLNLVGEQGLPMVFNIDLLKGRGIPLKTSPRAIAIVAAGIVIPFIIFVMMLGVYLNNRVSIPIMEHEMAVYNQKMQTLSEGVKLQQMFYKDKDSINASVPEAASAVGKFAAWSPVIRAVAENVPSAMVLNNFAGRYSAVKSPQGVDSVCREIEMSVSGSAKANWDEEVKAFRDRLLENSALKSRLQDIPIGHQSSKSGEKDSVSYDMRMVFKSNM
jgi:hypothetical protein